MLCTHGTYCLVGKIDVKCIPSYAVTIVISATIAMRVTERPYLVEASLRQ